MELQKRGSKCVSRRKMCSAPLNAMDRTLNLFSYHKIKKKKKVMSFRFVISQSDCRP